MMNFHGLHIMNFLPAFILSLVFQLTTTLATFDNISFSFTNFNSNDHLISLEGDASIMSPIIRLAADLRYQDFINKSGRATYYKPMHLWDNVTGNMADFSTQFTFVINSRGSKLYGDGLAFFLAPIGSKIPDESGGGNLALMSDYGRNTSDFTSAFIAVEFDTYYYNSYNPWDPSCEHLGVDINDIASSKTVCVQWLDYSVKTGQQLHARITYDSSLQNLSVILVEDHGSSSSGENVSSLSSIVNLKDYLPEWVIFGFSASTGALFELHTLHTWEFNSSLRVPANDLSGAKKSNHTRLWVILGGLGGIIPLILVPCLCWLFCRSKMKGKDELTRQENRDTVSISEELKEVIGGRKFCPRELVMAMNNFADSRLLGQGGFGRVYEGHLTNTTHVAIKKITPGSSQGVKEYTSEVKTISQLRHQNLVQLIGWCHEKKEFLLVYEFMSRGSLDYHLFMGKTLLSWEIRYKIAHGVALALLYLHEEWKQCVIHRDIKSSNIMLDEEFNAKLGDFGLARVVNHSKGARTTALAGTMGYMAPECIQAGKAFKESDIYSFGVVLLEIVTGIKVNDSRLLPDDVGLVEWVWEHYGRGSLLKALDHKLGPDFDEKQVKCFTILGLWCAHPDYKLRPSIIEVTSILNGEALPRDLPTKMPVPTYLAHFSGISMLPQISLTETATANEVGDKCA